MHNVPYGYCRCDANAHLTLTAIRDLLAGQHVLLNAHVAIFKIICAIGALIFSVYNIVVFAWEYGKQRLQQRAASYEPIFASTSPAHAMFEYDESLCVITNCPSRPDTPHWRWLGPFYDQNPRARQLVESIFPRISEAHRKIESCVTALTLSSLVSGFLLGLTGSATSPSGQWWGQYGRDLYRLRWIW